MSDTNKAYCELHAATKDLMDSFTAYGPKLSRVRKALEVVPELGSIAVNKHFLNELYCSGYRSGHHDTVEGGYTDVLSSDWDTYFDEEVAEIIKDSNAGDEGQEHG